MQEPPEFPEEGLVRYKLVQRGQRLFAHTNVSDCQEQKPCQKMSCKVFDTPEQARDWYRFQRRFDVIGGNHCLRMRFLHSVKCRVLFEFFDQDVDEWLEETLESRDLRFWLIDHRWWERIRENFISIFQPILTCLHRMHESNRYHGNLLKGIVVRNDRRGVCGFLYNMQENLRDNQPILINDGKDEDFGDLIRTMRRVVEYPWQTAARRRDMYGMALKSPTIPEFENLCMYQLNKWPYDVDRRWVMRPAFFWDVQERVKFLRALHRLLYKHKNNGLLRFTASSRFSDSWQQTVRSAGLLQIYNRNPSQYTDPLSKLLLWRNAQEHYNLNEQNVTCVRIHEVFSGELDIFFEALQAMTFILRSGDSSITSRMPCFFQEMEW